MRRTLRGVVALAAALLATLLPACGPTSTMRIRAEQDPSVDLTRYATYGWAVPARSTSAPARGERELLDWRIRAAVDEQLVRRGYTTAASGRPDMLVDYQVTTREKQLQDTPGEYIRYRSEGGRQDWGSAWVRGYEEGSLVVEVLDGTGRRLLWRGAATAVVNPDLREQRLPEAVSRMFEGFPARDASAAGGAGRARAMTRGTAARRMAGH